jgi:hypothetical protein
VRIPRTSLTLALALGVLAAAGCGGSGSKGRSASGAVPPSPRASAPVAVRGNESAHAQYAGFARAVNLRPADLPGWIVEPQKPTRHRSPNSKSLAAKDELRRCAATFKEAKAVYKLKSPSYSAGAALHRATATSEVSIEPSAALARRELAAVRRLVGRPSTRACLARAFELSAAPNAPSRNGVKVRIHLGRLRLAPFPVGSIAPGASDGIGLTFALPATYTVTAPGRLPVRASLLTTFDAIVVLVGRAEASVTTLDLGGQFPAKQEAGLLALVASRAVAASHAYPTVLK